MGVGGGSMSVVRPSLGVLKTLIVGVEDVAGRAREAFDAPAGGAESEARGGSDWTSSWGPTRRERIKSTL